MYFFGELKVSHETRIETYHFYYPIYNLRKPSNDIKLGYSTILTFDNLPKIIQEKLLVDWKFDFMTHKEYARTLEEYITRKKTATFLYLEVKATSNDEASEKAFKMVKDSVSILSFLYWFAYFPIHHCVYIKEEGSELSGGYGEYYYIPSLWICEYEPKYEEEISKLTEVLTKPKSDIDWKIRNTLIIFGIQTSITNEQVRFVLLTTCLESLLLTKSDRGCLRLRLAEKTAFLSKNKGIVNEGIKLAYKKRSAFIHADPDTSPSKTIVEDDLTKMQGTVISILHRLMQFKEQGYSSMSEVNKYIEELKFGEIL